MPYSDAITHARDVRKRLRNPANAVADRGIELRPVKVCGLIIPMPQPAQRHVPPQKKAKPPQKVTPKVAPKATPTVAPNVARLPPAVSPKTLAAVARLKRRIRLIAALLERLEQRRGIMERSAQPSVEAIMRATCAHFGVALIDMLSERRLKAIMRPRQIAAYLARQLTSQSLPQIGRRMRRDHTAIMHSVRKIEALRASDPRIDDAVRAISDALRGASEPA